MGNTPTDIEAPKPPQGALTVDQAQYGNPIPPPQQIVLYSSDQWEGFTQQWAHFCLKPLYLKVERFTGAGGA